MKIAECGGSRESLYISRSVGSHERSSQTVLVLYILFFASRFEASVCVMDLPSRHDVRTSQHVAPDRGFMLSRINRRSTHGRPSRSFAALEASIFVC